MRIIKQLLFIVLTLSILVGCEDKKKNSNVESNLENELSDTNTIDNSLENSIAEIDQLTENPSQVAYSMSFTNDIEDIQIEVLFIGDQPLKINERFTHTLDHTYGVRTYYLSGQELIATKEVKEEMAADSTFHMRETRNQYVGGKLTYGETRIATYEEELELYAFEKMQPVEYDFERVMAMLKNTGEYVMSFADIIETPNATYLLLKTQGSPALSSAVMLEYRDAFTDQLLANKKKFVGKKVDLEIEMTTRDGMTYQAYRSGRFIE